MYIKPPRALACFRFCFSIFFHFFFVHISLFALNKLLIFRCFDNKEKLDFNFIPLFYIIIPCVHIHITIFSWFCRNKIE